MRIITQQIKKAAYKKVKFLNKKYIIEVSMYFKYEDILANEFKFEIY